MTNLVTDYMGLSLRNPLVASASPISRTVDGVRRLADAGVGAVVLHSLFEEELAEESERNARIADAGTESFAESLSYLPGNAGEDPGPRRYLSLVERATAAVEIPVIASLNGVTPGGWSGYAQAIQSAGAVAIELNIYYLPGSADISGRRVERRHLEILEQVKSVVTIPVAVKLSPYFSSTAEMVKQLDDAGADAVVLFNRFMQPDIDPESLQASSGPGLSISAESLLPRTWIALLSKRISASLAASTGVETAEDVVKYLLAGSDVVMSTSSLLRHGPGYAEILLDGLSDWMARKGFSSLSEVRGRFAVPAGVDASYQERSGYVATLRNANASAYGLWPSEPVRP